MVTPCPSGKTEVGLHQKRAKGLRKLPARLVENAKPARFWRTGSAGRVRCELCPRHCNIPPGGLGFCGVRHNRDGSLWTLNYGLSVAPTEETIESEAIYHYAPGTRILSLGNIGCMMSCDFCHNWQTSQARLAHDRDIVELTPEGVVDYAIRHGIRILSWTYNDPVVWHEFVVDTARLARSRGLLNLYKSAFYISPDAVDELCDVIDIFSLSLKSMDHEFYRRHTRGRLEPVLAAIERVHRAARRGKAHLEISNLCVTGRNDTVADARKTARWIRDHLDADVPLHFVRFHPDYKYRSVPRTSIRFLEAARRAALEEGLRHVYLGNVLGSDASHTRCNRCGELLVERCGSSALVHETSEGCPSCGTPSPIAYPLLGLGDEASSIGAEADVASYQFRADVDAYHVQQDGERPIEYALFDARGDRLGAPRTSSCRRFLIARGHPQAVRVELRYHDGRAPVVFEVADRAHFPVER